MCDCRLIYFQALSAIFIIIMIISLARLVFVVVSSHSLSLCISLFLSPAQFSRSRRKLFNAEMGNVMKKFLFFLSLCRGVLRVERKRKEEKKAQETPFISDVLFSLLCSPSLSLPHSRFFLPSVLPLKQIISNEIRKRRQRKKTEREGKRERKKLSVQQVGKFCCQVEVKVAPAVATECARGGEGGQEGRRSKMNS